MSPTPATACSAASSTARPPHAPLTNDYASEHERHQFVRRIFDDTVADDDRVEKLLAWIELDMFSERSAFKPRDGAGGSGVSDESVAPC